MECYGEVVWDRFRKTRSQVALWEISFDSFGSNAAANSSFISYVSSSLLGSEQNLQSF